jgi:hypothetical protein
VSRRHLQISLGKGRGQFVATNISGRNVVKVNGVAIADQADFKMGDPVEIGEFSITVGYLEAEKPASPSGKPRTMLIDRSALAKAAFVDGDGAVAPGGRLAR